MKGWCFYQNPNEKRIQGYRCSIDKLSSLTTFEEGFLVTTFDKSEVYCFQTNSELKLSEIEEVQLENNEVVSIGLEEYTESIEKSIEFCRTNKGKVVFSRVIKQPVEKGFSIPNFFRQLCEEYSHSFNYCFHIENVGTWIGATPEILIREDKTQCRVYSLAGSRSIKEPFNWTEKEIAEQKFVTSEVANVLEKEKVDFQLSPVKTIRAGNVEHLLSEFTFSHKDVLNLADRLHPTPAVCGLPRKKALDFINTNEPHDRKFYAGIIGWKKVNKVSLYVNLRCAEITGKALNCYVGGGITQDSKVMNEWKETAFKAQTLLSVFKKSGNSHL